MIETALELRDLLQATEHRIVLAESCTAGRIAATLGIIPGISQWFCGSFVIYRNDSKASWLGIPTELLDDPQIGPVSAEVTRRLAQEALGRTGEADVALAITGEIGPGVTADNDGLLYCAVQFREHKHNDCQQYRLELPAPENARDYGARLVRLEEATEWALRTAIAALAAKRESRKSE